MYPTGFFAGELKELRADLFHPQPSLDHIRVIDADLSDMIYRPRDYLHIQQTLRQEGPFHGFRVCGYIHPMYRSTYVISPDEKRTKDSLQIHRSPRGNLPYHAYDADVREAVVVGTLYVHPPHNRFWVHRYQLLPDNFYSSSKHTLDD